MSSTDSATDPVAAFITAACGKGGSIDAAEAILGARPDIADSSLYVAAILGDANRVRRFVTVDAASAKTKGGPLGWDPLTYLCFSRYLRRARRRSGSSPTPESASAFASVTSAGFVSAAEALLDAGADPNTGYFDPDHRPSPTLESAIYGAAGIAHHPELTKLLLDRGADPNDDETPYHSPETYGDNETLQILVDSQKLTPRNLSMMLIRKLDWTDYDAVEWLLQHGADPNLWPALHHALWRVNALRAFELLLQHGADPALPAPSYERGGWASSFIGAAHMGRADVLDLFARHGFTPMFEGDDAFIAACARADDARAREIVASDPAIVTRVQAADPPLLANFAGAGNTNAVRLLLDLGFDIAASRTDAAAGRGDTALHVAIWHERLDTVKLLLERGAPLEATNRRGQTPLTVAARALIDLGEWTPHASTGILTLLLDAGARVDAVTPFPTGSAMVDTLLQRDRQGE